MGDLSPAETSTAVKVPPADPTFEKISLGELSSVSTKPPEIWKKGGRLLSGMLGINIVLLGCGLVSSGAFTDVSVAEREVLSFLSVLMGLTSIWMVSYLLWTSKHKNNLKLKDSHAGPIWLRGGLVLFGVCSLVLDVLKIGKSVTLIHCESPVKIAHPVIQFVFVVIQKPQRSSMTLRPCPGALRYLLIFLQMTYFLWVSCKDCAQIHMNLTRCGLMITLSTNLAIWMAAVTDESLHQTHALNTGVNHTSNVTAGVRAAGGGSHGCDCVTDLCKTFQNGYYYLYPFNIEYSLFASAMSYVMWKNVGRVMSEHHHHTQHKFKTRNLFVGLICGIGVLVAGLGVFIVYKIEVDTEDSKSQAMTMFYIFNIIALSLMSIGSLAGTIIYRFDKRGLDNHKNPTRTLDVALLLGAALGQYCISYFSIVAMIALQPGQQLHTLILVNALLLIVQHTLQNTFIIEGLHRQPQTNNHHPAELQEKDLSPHVYVNPAATDSHGNHSPSSNGKHECELKTNHIGTPTSFPEYNSKTDWRRKILKEISLFLLVSNIIFWIIPAFGARPQFDNGLELKFYGDNMWVVIVNIGLPFGIFYRMHSVASLVEVYIMT